MTVTIYHNPRCSKSRQALSLLQEQGHEPRIVDYLKSPPDRATLEVLARKLGLSPLEMMRTGEDAFKTDRDAVQAMDDDGRLNWLASNPQVLQRPIVVAGNLARIGRPPASVLEILPEK